MVRYGRTKIPEFDIYPVITERFCRNGSSVKTLKEVIKGGVKIVQLREKEKSKREIYKLALEFRKLTSDAGISLIINDHLDIALAVGADGVHLGQDDLPCKVARKLAPGFIIGVSTHSLKEALEAEKDGADYVNIGPIFPTTTKTGQKALGVGVIKKVSDKLRVPFTVMGGIKQTNIKEVVLAGAKRIAMITEITMAEDIPLKIKELRETIISTSR